MLEHTAETDYLAASLIDTITDYLVVRVEGRGNVTQRTVLVGLLHAQFHYVEAIVHLEVIAHMTEVEGIETGLCVAQSYLHLAHLQHLIRMMRTNTERLPAVYDILSKSKGKIGNSVFSFLVAYRVIIE